MRLPCIIKFCSGMRVSKLGKVAAVGLLTTLGSVDYYM